MTAVVDEPVKWRTGMPGTRRRGEEVRNFILHSVEAHPSDVAQLATEKFKISRQTANEHLRRQCAEEVLTGTGETSARIYTLRVLKNWQKTYQLASGIHKDEILDVDVATAIGDLPQSVRRGHGIYRDVQQCARPLVRSRGDCRNQKDCYRHADGDSRQRCRDFQKDSAGS